MMTYYKLIHYLNASHSFEDLEEHAHMHTFEITLYIEVLHDQEDQIFHRMDTYLEQYFKTYEGTYLNDNAKIRTMNPSLENIGDYFYESLRELLQEKNMKLIQLEISENPLRRYIVSERILLTSEYLADNRRRWENMLQNKNRVYAMLRREREFY